MKQLLCSLLLASGLSAAAQPLEKANAGRSGTFYQRHKTVLMHQFGRFATEADLRFLLSCIIDRGHLEVDYNQYFRPSQAPLAHLAFSRSAQAGLMAIKNGFVYPLVRFVLPRVTPLPTVNANSSVGERIAAQSHRYLGVRYGPPSFNRQTGQGALDCSGLVRYVFEDLNVTLHEGSSVAGLVDSPDLRRITGEPAPGDLLVRKHKNNRWSHVGIYVGKHQLIEAPYSGTVVRITPYKPTKWHGILRYSRD